MFVKFRELKKIREIHKSEKIVLVGGCYDMLHIGHAAHLKNCAAYGDVLVVAVVSDKRIKKIKGDDRPVISEENRAELLSSLRSVDYSLIAPDPQKEGDPTTVHILKSLRPDLLITSETVPHSLRFGARVKFIGETRLGSTTEIIEVIKSR